MFTLVQVAYGVQVFEGLFYRGVVMLDESGSTWVAVLPGTRGVEDGFSSLHEAAQWLVDNTSTGQTWGEMNGD